MTGVMNSLLYNVQDRLLDLDNTDDFGTAEDDAAKAQQQMEAEERDRRSVDIILQSAVCL